MYSFTIPINNENIELVTKICEYYDCKVISKEDYYYTISVDRLENIFWLGANLHMKLIQSENQT